MPPISPKSRSFLRLERGKSNAKEFAHGVNIPQEFIIKNSKSTLRKWMIQFHNDKCVVNADLLNIKTREEIKHIKKDLGDYLTEKFKDTEFKGIVDLHPTSDTTCNTGHIHYWGSGAKKMERAISEYVVEKGLSVTQRAEELRITSTNFKLNIKNTIESQEELKSKLESDEVSKQLNKTIKESKDLINEVNNNIESIKAHLTDVEDYLKPIAPVKLKKRKKIKVENIIDELSKERFKNLARSYDLIEFSLKYIKNYLENLPKNDLGNLWSKLDGYYDYNELKGTNDEPSREYLVKNTISEIESNLNSIQNIDELKDECMDYYNKALKSDEALLKDEIKEVAKLQKIEFKENKNAIDTNVKNSNKPKM